MSYAAKNEMPVAFPPSDKGSLVRVWLKNSLVKIPAMRVNTLTAALVLGIRDMEGFWGSKGG